MSEISVETMSWPFSQPFLEFSNHFNDRCIAILHRAGDKFDVTFANREVPAFISGGVLLNTVYIFESMHFHWPDCVCQFGEAKVLDQSPFSIEAYAIHYNSKYESVADAYEMPDGVAIAVFLIKSKLNAKDCPFFNVLIDSALDMNDKSSMVVDPGKQKTTARERESIGTVDKKSYFCHTCYSKVLITVPDKQIMNNFYAIYTW